MNIVIANSKGGVGKSTVAVFLTMIAAERERTMLVDSGYQRHSTDFFAEDWRGPSLLDQLLNKKKDCTVTIPDANIDLLASSINLANFGDYFQGIKAEKRDLIFSTALSPRLKNYKYTVIDTESSLSSLTRNALLLAERIIIPVMDIGSIREAKKLIDLLEQLKEAYKMNECRVYILPVMRRKFSLAAGKMNAMIREALGEHRFLKPIGFHNSIFLGDKDKMKTGPAYRDYKNSLEEVLNG